MDVEDNPLLVNPWNVGSLEDFLVYSCPECLTFERTQNAFVEHATNAHPSSHELMVSLGLFDSEPSVKKEPLDVSESVEFVPDPIRQQPVTSLTPNKPVQPIQLQNEVIDVSKINDEQHVMHQFVNDAIREQLVTPVTPNNSVQPIQLQDEFIDVSKIKAEQQQEESNSLVDIESINRLNEQFLASADRVFKNGSEHETSEVLRAPSFIFFKKLVPAKANIQANIWEDRTEIPSGPKENVMYVVKNFNKDTTGRYKNPSCDYGPWKACTHTNQYRIKDNTLQWMGPSEDRDYGISDCEKVVIKNSRAYLLADPKYMKMVTYIKQCPEDYISAKDYCAVEYVGTDLFGPNTKPHGNSKNENPYKRNNPYIMEEAKDKIKKGKLSVKEVLSELSDSSTGKSLSAKTISNLKTGMKKKKENKSEGDLISDQTKIENDDL